MPSPTSRLRLLKQAPGSNFDSWGTQLNAGALDIVDEGFGVAAIAVGDNVTLTSANYLTDQSRRLVLHLTGAGGFTVTTPAVDKPYLVVNDCTANVTITPSGGTGVTVRAGVASWVWCDGTDAFVVDTTLDKIATAAADVALGGNKLTGVADPTDAQDGATKAYVDGEITTSEERTLDVIPAPVAAVGFNGQRLTGVADGVDGTDGVNKAQVEAITAADAQAAADSAAAALISEGNASGSAAAALASEEAAAILFTDFQKRYLGPKAAAPTLDNEGNALEAGALYFNTSSGAMTVYDGANWIPIEALALASQAQAEAGTNNDTAMTPLRTAQNVTARIVNKATAEAGTDNTKVMTPLRTKEAIDALAPSPGLVLLSTQTVTTAVASVDFTTGIDDTYDEYEIRIYNAIPVTDNTNLWMRTSTDGTLSDYAAGGAYEWYTHRMNASVSAGGGVGAVQNRMVLNHTANGIGSDVNEFGWSGTVTCHNPADTSSYKRFHWIGIYTDFNGSIAPVNGGGARLSAAVVNNIRFQFESGNVESGVFRLYGVRK